MDTVRQEESFKNANLFIVLILKDFPWLSIAFGMKSEILNIAKKGLCD